ESALRGEDRAGRLLSVSAEAGLPDPGRATVLDIGSGTGNLLAAVSGRFEHAVGVDIAMRWLHLSRRRFRDRGLPEPALVCCCAEALPFPNAYFDSAFSLGTLEFARIPEMLLEQTARVLKPGGFFFLNTVNRFSAAPEPHVNLLGVGYLPRAWQAPYVRWRRRASFEHIVLRSRGELDRLLTPNFASREIRLPLLSDGDLAGFSPARRAAAKIYRVASRLSLFKNALRWIVPEWDVVLRKA
ncbi:MAG TPA: class I SAM-dependent methyltransferase, partial [Thermoanaerobaculia bacterium]|nr:class I SAM-dependent methyltransferase [Thermoanaerobaculia bacterium]